MHLRQVSTHDIWTNRTPMCMVHIHPCLCLPGHALHSPPCYLPLPQICAYPNLCRFLTTVVQITVVKVGWFICDTPDTLLISVWIPTVILQQLHLWVRVFSTECLFSFLRVPWQTLSSRHSDWESPCVKHAFLWFTRLHSCRFYSSWCKWNCCSVFTWKERGLWFNP